jgi:hypothetical protein
MNERVCVSKAVKRLILVRRILCVGFVFGFTAVPVGFVLGPLSLILGSVLVMAGLAVVAALVVASYVVIPFVRCPACNKPFFVPEGALGLVSRINPFQHRCIHCRKEVDEK